MRREHVDGEVVDDAAGVSADCASARLETLRVDALGEARPNPVFDAF